MTLTLDLTRYAVVTGAGLMALMSGAAFVCLLAIGGLWIRERFS